MTNIDDLSPAALACLAAIAAEWHEGGQPAFDDAGHTGHPARATDELLDAGLLARRTNEHHVALTEAGRQWALAHRENK